jgi:predicted short-subunit dehydrogenase-like oxidoreductase (DUF2520 family)
VSEISKTQRLPMRPRSRERLLVVGDGPVARALGAALEAADAAPLRWSRRTGAALPSADVVVLAVRDEAIGEVAAQIMSGVDEAATPPILLHCAGAVPAEEAFSGLKRRPLGVGVLHPLRSLAGAPSDAQLAGTVFAVEGDGPGREAALRLVERVGGLPLVLEAEQLPRYHAAAALVSNHAVGLVDAGVELLSSVGLERAATWPWWRGTSWPCGRTWRSRRFIAPRRGGCQRSQPTRGAPRATRCSGSRRYC